MNETKKQPAKEDLKEWARNFSQEKRNSIDYFLKYGNPTERALVEKVLELANGAEA
jgi:hypothetical protein